MGPIMSAGSVAAARPESIQAGGGAIPTPALQSIQVRPVSVKIAKEIIVRNHYLHSLPGGTQMTFGVFLEQRLLGALALGVGAFNSRRLVSGATHGDCICLTRLWLADDLPKNSESRVLAVVLRSLVRNTTLKFVATYADPSAGHVGTIYQATGWLYTGMSEPSVLYDIGDGVLRNSRTLGHAYGTRSSRYFSEHGVELKGLRQEAKHRYLYFLDKAWSDKLNVPVRPYPKSNTLDGFK